MNPAILYLIVKSPSVFARNNGTWRRPGNGRNNNTPNKLKVRCTKAMIRVSLARAYKRTAMNAVTVVPIFAPRMNGAAFLRETKFFATIGTTNEVVMVLDLIAPVSTTPHVKDFSGLSKKNLPKDSGCLTFSAFETIRRNKSIDRNNNPTAISTKAIAGM